MYTSYNGWSNRSKSTTDVYRASTSVSELETDSSYPPASFSTLSRVGSRRRRRETTASSPNISRARSYLTDDVRKQFEHGFETSSTSDECNHPTEDTPPSSARSNNFVKRLVETLERRQREQQQQQQRNVIGGSKLVNHEFYKVGGVRGGDTEVRRKLTEKVHGKVLTGRLAQEKKERDEDQEKPKVPERKSTVLEEKPKVVLEKKHEERPTMPIRIRPSHLENLYEHEEEYVSSDDDYSYRAYYDEREPSTTQENDANTTSKSSKPKKITTARRTLKNVITTLKSWRLGSKSLPKGSRDYYATRESLSEEMRAFRRDTMPRLMKHSQMKNLRVVEQRDKKLQTPREFTNSIGSPSMMGEEREPSTATIHSLHGAQGRLSRYPDVARVRMFELVMDETDDVPHCSKKVDPPSVPASPGAPEPEPLIRPEMYDIEKRYSSDSDKVELRRCMSSQLNASTTTLDVIYDVPRSIIPITEDMIVNQRLRLSSGHEYANISSDIGDDDDDKRLHCTAFTTF